MFEYLLLLFHPLILVKVTLFPNRKTQKVLFSGLFWWLLFKGNSASSLAVNRRGKGHTWPWKKERFATQNGFSGFLFRFWRIRLDWPLLDDPHKYVKCKKKVFGGKKSFMGKCCMFSSFFLSFPPTTSFWLPINQGNAKGEKEETWKTKPFHFRFLKSWSL